MTFKHLPAAALLAFTLASPLGAQDITQLAQDYVNMPEIQTMMADMFAPDAVLAQFKASLPASIELNSDQETRIGALLSNAMLEMKPQLEGLMIDGLTEHFSADEIAALIDFYSSEHGASVMTKMQPFMQDVLAQLAPQLNSTMQDVSPRIVEIIQGG